MSMRGLAQCCCIRAALPPACLVTTIVCAQVTGFSNTEEDGVGLSSAVPFMLEDSMKKAGGEYNKGEDWKPYAIGDGQLITGQNPQSSKQVAELVNKRLA
jgi:putative intracellular protease/amidase